MPPSVGTRGSENVIYDESQETEYIRDTQLSTNKKMKLPFSREYKKELLAEALNINPLFRTIQNTLKNSDRAIMTSAMFRDIVMEEYLLIDGDPESPAVVDGTPRIPFIDIAILNKIVYIAKEVNIDSLPDGVVLTPDGHINRLASAVQQSEISGVPIDQLLAREKETVFDILQPTKPDNVFDSIVGGAVTAQTISPFDFNHGEYLSQDSIDIYNKFFNNVNYANANEETRYVIDTVMEVANDISQEKWLEKNKEFAEDLLSNMFTQSSSVNVMIKLMDYGFLDGRNSADLQGFIESLTPEEYESDLYKRIINENGSIDTAKARDVVANISIKYPVASAMVDAFSFSDAVAIDELSEKDQMQLGKTLLELGSLEEPEIQEFVMLKLQNLKYSDGRPLYDIKDVDEIQRATLYVGRSLLRKENDPEWEFDEVDGEISIDSHHPAYEYISSIESLTDFDALRDRFVHLHDHLELKEKSETGQKRPEFKSLKEMITYFIKEKEMTRVAKERLKVIEDAEKMENSGEGRFFSNQYNEIELVLDNIKNTEQENADIILKKIFIETYKREFARTYGRLPSNDNIHYMGTFVKGTEISNIERIANDKNSPLYGFLDGLVSYNEKGIRQIDFEKFDEIEKKSKELGLDKKVKKGVTDVEVVSERGYEEDKRNLNFLKQIVKSIKEISTDDKDYGSIKDYKVALSTKDREKEVKKILAIVAKLPNDYTRAKHFQYLLLDDNSAINVPDDVKQLIKDQLVKNKAKEVYRAGKDVEGKRHHVAAPKNPIAIFREQAHIRFRNMDIKRALRLKRGYTQMVDESQNTTALAKTGHAIANIYNKLHYRFTGVATRELINMRIDAIAKQQQEFNDTEDREDDTKIYRYKKDKSKREEPENEKLEKKIDEEIKEVPDPNIEVQSIDEKEDHDVKIYAGENKEKARQESKVIFERDQDEAKAVESEAEQRRRARVASVDENKVDMAERILDDNFDVSHVYELDYHSNIPGRADNAEAGNEFFTREELKKFSQIRRIAEEDARLTHQVEEIKKKISTIKNQEGKEAQYYRHELEVRQARQEEIKKGNLELIVTSDDSSEYMDAYNKTAKEIRDREIEKQIKKGKKTTADIMKIFSIGVEEKLEQQGKEQENADKTTEEPATVKQQVNNNDVQEKPDKTVEESVTSKQQVDNNVEQEKSDNQVKDKSGVSNPEHNDKYDFFATQKEGEIQENNSDVKKESLVSIIQNTMARGNEETKRFQSQFRAFLKDRDQAFKEHNKIVEEAYQGHDDVVEKAYQQVENMTQADQNTESQETKPEGVVNELLSGVIPDIPKVNEVEEKPSLDQDVKDSNSTQVKETKDPNGTQLQEETALKDSINQSNDTKEPQDKLSEQKSSFEASLRVDNAGDKLEKKALDQMHNKKVDGQKVTVSVGNNQEQENDQEEK